MKELIRKAVIEEQAESMLSIINYFIETLRYNIEEQINSEDTQRTLDGILIDVLSLIDELGVKVNI